MRSATLFKALGCVLCFLLVVSFVALGEEVERSTSFSVQGTYYLPDNKGYGVSDGGFAPITYDPEKNPEAPMQTDRMPTRTICRPVTRSSARRLREEM